MFCRPVVAIVQYRKEPSLGCIRDDHRAEADLKGSNNYLGEGVATFILFFWRGGLRPWQAGEACSPEGTRETLGIKNQSCPMLGVSHKAM